MQSFNQSRTEPLPIAATQNTLIDSSAQEILNASQTLSGNKRQCVFNVPDIRCGGCISRIESEIAKLDNVTHVRVNLTNKQVVVVWDSLRDPPLVLSGLRSLGYTPQLSIDTVRTEQDNTVRYLIRALAVSAFASGNIMLLSVSVWSGAEQQTKHLFHVLSALIALPAVAYSGQIFFQSAWRSVRSHSTNMDVPISIGILLTLGLSCYDTFIRQSTDAVYFEAPVMLVFFLLIGRTLDHLMREKARDAVAGLAKLQPTGAWKCQTDSSVTFLPLAEISVGDKLLIPADEYIAIDCIVNSGSSDVDFSLVTGESAPRGVSVNDKLLAGTHNLTASLYATATAGVNESYLSQMISLIQNIESTRSRGRKLADKISTWYAPVVHLAALLSCMGWYYFTGDIHHSVTIAVAVLIITCPCALGLAVPMVQVVIARRLFEAGILVKDGSALERLAEIDTVVFDKTGTLTSGNAQLINSSIINPEAFRTAASMARNSTHPYSTALLSAYKNNIDSVLPDSPASVEEYPGYGLELNTDKGTYRLGRPTWAAEHKNIVAEAKSNILTAATEAPFSKTILTHKGEIIAEFLFEDSPRLEAAQTVNALRGQGLNIHCLSGDTKNAVSSCMTTLAIDKFKAEQLPADKVSYLNSLAQTNHKVMMIGDGLNDAPALAAAHVSMAPGSASEVGRNSADLVFTRNNLQAVLQAFVLAQTAKQSIRQNLTIALVYNAIALPLAIGGWVTPIVAALSMSGSSILVMANALRLNSWRSSNKIPINSNLLTTQSSGKVKQYA